MTNIELTEATIGYLDTELKEARGTCAELLKLEELYDGLLVQCHGNGRGVRYLLEWHGEGDAPEEVLVAIVAAGATLPKPTRKQQRGMRNRASWDRWAEGGALD